MFQFLTSTFLMGVGLSTGLLGGSPLPVSGATLDLDFASSRYNNAMGPEQVGNSEFAADISLWTPYASGGGNVAGVTWDTGSLAILGTGTGITGAYQAVPTVPGKTYELTVVPRTGSQALNIIVNDGAAPGGGTLLVSGIQVFTTTVKVSFVALSTQSTVSFNRGGAATARLESVSVREVNPTNLGNELLVNPDLATDLTGWSGSGFTAGVVTWAAGQMVVAPHTSAITVGQTMANTVAGRLYEASITIAAFAGSAITFAVGTSGIGDTSLGQRNISAPGEYRIQFTATDATSQPFIYRGVTTGNVVIERWSVREVNPSVASLLTVVRATPGWAQGSDGIFVEFAPNTPRITDRGILREEARTNQILWSDDFANAAWGKTNGSISSVPRQNVFGGGTTAKFVENTVNAGHNLRVTFGGAMGTQPITGYFILEAAERSVVTMLLFENGGSYRSAHFNLRTGVATAGNTSLVGNHTMIDLGGGRYLCAITATFVSGTTGCYLDFRLSDIDTPANAGASYQGDGVSGVYVHHAELGVGAFPLSPIRTAGTIGSRNADSITMPIGPWYNPAATTLYAEAQSSDFVNPSPCIVSLDETVGQERIQVRKGTSGNGNGVVVDNNVVQASFVLAQNIMAGGAYGKVALAAETNSANMAGNGTLGTLDTVVTMPTPTRMEIGMGVAVSPLNGYIKRIAYYARRLSDAELQALTT